MSSSKNLLDIQLNQEQFVRLAGAVGAIELQKAVDGPVHTLEEARAYLIEAGHNAEDVNQAIEAGLYQSGTDSYFSYSNNLAQLYTNLTKWIKHCMDTIPKFEMGSIDSNYPSFP